MSQSFDAMNEVDGNTRSHSLTSPFVAFKRFADGQLASFLNITPAATCFPPQEDIFNVALASQLDRRHGAPYPVTSGANSLPQKCPYDEQAIFRMLEDEIRTPEHYSRGFQRVDEGMAVSKHRTRQIDKSGMMPSNVLTLAHSPARDESRLPDLPTGTFPAKGALHDTISTKHGGLMATKASSNEPDTADATPQLSCTRDYRGGRCPRLAHHSWPSPLVESDSVSVGILNDVISRLMSPLLHDAPTPGDMAKALSDSDDIYSAFRQTSLAEPEGKNSEGLSHKQKSHDSVQSSQTSLDVVGKLLGTQREPDLHGMFGLIALDREGRSSGRRERPDMISTLETTSRTMSPDGRISIKTTVRKMFSDGREESSETHHHQHVLASPRKVPCLDTEKPATGWFWR